MMHLGWWKALRGKLHWLRAWQDSSHCMRIMQLLCLVVTIVATIIYVWTLLYGDWTRATYDYDALRQSLNGTAIEYLELNASDGRRVGAILIDTRDEIVPECMSISRQRENEDGESLPPAPYVVRNKTIIMDETAGINSLCRIDFTEELAQRLNKSDMCENVYALEECVNYYSEYSQTTIDLDRFDDFCCQSCCPYERNFRWQLANAGLTTHEATFEIVSCVIVAIILLIISYVLLAVRIFVGSVISVRLAGATFIMTGLYVLFSMAFTLYQSTNVNAERTMGYLPAEALRVRIVYLSIGAYAGFVASALFFCVGVLWCYYSRLLTRSEMYSVANTKSEHEHKPKTTNKNRTSRPASAVQAKVNNFARDATADAQYDNRAFMNEANHVANHT